MGERVHENVERALCGWSSTNMLPIEGLRLAFGARCFTCDVGLWRSPPPRVAPSFVILSINGMLCVDRSNQPRECAQ